MPTPEKPPPIVSLFGPLRTILIPESAAFDDPRDMGRAIVAWKFNLSRVEVQTLELVAKGYTNGEIAERMENAEENTIRNRLKLLFLKLDVDNRTKAAVIATRFGLDGDSE